MATTPRFTCRRAYDVDHDIREGNAVAFFSDEPSMTQQHFTLDADVNEIARRFGLVDKQLPPVAFNEGLSDLRNVPDLRTILDQVRDAKERFLGLPLKVRARFDNNLNKMWTFLQDPDNHEEAVRLGLLHQEKPATASAAAAPASGSGPTGPSTPDTTVQDKEKK